MLEKTDTTPRITRLFISHPKTVVILTILITIIFGFFGRQIQRDHSGEGMLPADEPIREYFDEFKKHFNIRDQIVIALHNEQGVFTPKMLVKVDRISKYLAHCGFTDEVKSLATFENITGVDGGIIIEPFVEKLPQTMTEAKAIERAIKSFPLAEKFLVSEDGKSTLILAQPNFHAWEKDKSAAAYDAIKAFLDADKEHGEYYIAGFPIITGLSDKYMDRDNMVMVPLILLVVICLLWFSFRSLRGVWIPLIVVLAATTWTFGVMSLLGVKITIISISIPVVLIAMGIADGIHIIHEYYHHLRDGKENLKAVQITMKEMNGPVIMTSFTTAAGFLALFTADIVPIREYGAAVAFGILAAMIFSLSFIPACLVLLGKPKKVLSDKVAQEGVLHNFSRAIGNLGLKHAKTVVLVFIAGLVIAGFVASHLRANNNPIEFFRKSSGIYKASQFINHNFPGTGSIHVQIDSGKQDGLKNPALLEKIALFQDRLEEMKEVGNTLSVADYLSRLHLVLHNGDPSYNRVPGTARDIGPDPAPNAGLQYIGQYLLMYEIAEGTDLARTVDTNYQRANVELNIKSTDSDTYGKVIAKIDFLAEEIFGDNYKVQKTGAGIINQKVVKYLVVGQIYSLAVSFIVVFLMLIILFRSPLHAIIGVLPLLITIVVNFALMVLAKIPLNMGTALIASVCIGIGVDYSIHFISRYRIESGRRKYLSQTIAATMDTSGRAIFLNAAAISCGFAVLLFSKFMVLAYLGFLIPMIMLLNALGALLVIPAFLNLLAKRKGEKVGDDNDGAANKG